ncbi:MAG: hypothetical protein WA705_28445 [Candidatus Ozemobacteraceae bacterium]
MSRISWILFALILGISLFSQGQVSAWGPMTHLAVNEQAYEEAMARMGGTCCVPRSLSPLFIAGGPSPDVKFTGGDAFPLTFHTSVEVIDRMIALAKNDAKYGLDDVVEALGWAGHLYSETTTAHTSNGYPNTKKTVTVANAGWVNHQLCEMAVDILTYRERQKSLSTRFVVMPLRLLSAAMTAENGRDPSSKIMTPEQIKVAAEAFLPTPLGIRTIADYLFHTRPELLDEMADFYSDRVTALDDSVAEVVRLLETQGRKDFSKTFAGSIDGTDRVHVPLTGDLKTKAKTSIMNMLSGALKTGKANDVFTVVAYAGLHAALANSLWRDKFLSVVQSAFGSSIVGDKQHQRIVLRYITALLSRPDLTYPEIIAYAEEGCAFDPTSFEQRKGQLVKQGLTSDGRKPVTLQQATAAAAEVERIEAVRQEWPIFWPFRPSEVNLAEAREKAARLLACAFLDGNIAQGSLAARAGQLLSQAKQLRTMAFTYRDASLFAPLAKWNAWKAVGPASDAVGKDERLFADLARISVALGGSSSDPQKLTKLTEQTARRLQETDQALANAKALRDQIPAWNLLKRSKAKDEIARLENTKKGLNEYLDALKTLKEGCTTLTAPGNAGVAASETARIEITGGTSASSPVVRAAQTKFEQAYREYVTLLQDKSGDDPKVKAALDRLSEASRVRRETATTTPSISK